MFWCNNMSFKKFLKIPENTLKYLKIPENSESIFISVTLYNSIKLFKG